jgi:hypothetical protein
MVFSQKLVIESTLSAGAARARMRAFATSRASRRSVAARS